MADRELTLPTLRARTRELSRRLGVAGFWTWWTRELDALVPGAPRAALERRRMRPVIVFAGDHATLWRPSLESGRAAMVEEAQIALAGDTAAVAAAGRAALAPMARMVYGGPAGAGRAVVSIPARDVLRKRIVLPAAVDQDLRQALAYDLDRHTPFPPSELYFDVAVVDRDPARGTIVVDLAAAKRTVVDAALRHLAAWGAQAAAVVPEPPERAARSRLNLLPSELRTGTNPWLRWQFLLPLALLALLALTAVAIPLWQKREYVKDLQALADQARARAAVSETLRLELDNRIADYNTALERKFAFPGVLAVVDTVSRVLPDDTWITQFEMKTLAKGKETQRELMLRGETANAGRLVQLFEESQFFAQAAQRGPTTKIQPGPGEIFDLGAQVKPRALPERLALVVGGTPAPAAPEEPATGAAAPPAPGAPSGPAAPAAGTAPATQTPATQPPATQSPAAQPPAAQPPAAQPPGAQPPGAQPPAAQPPAPAATAPNPTDSGKSSAPAPKK
ncbi:MAG: hypothetical protein U1F58_10755 [Burkholderiales bacterium]